MTDEQASDEGGQVSEVQNLKADTGGSGGDPAPISPGDSTAASPDDESGTAQEGTQGPDAPPRHGIPEEKNESSY